MTNLLLAATLLGVAAPADGADADLATLLRGRVAGVPIRCLPVRETSTVRIVAGTAIVYTIGDVVYVNRPDGADAMRGDDIPVLRSFDARICRPETVNLVDRASRQVHGFVRLGDFVPYRRAPAS